MRTGHRGLVLGVSAAAVLLGSVTAVQHRDEPDHYFGTLQTDPAKASAEHAEGVEVAHMTIRWDRFEPSPGRFDTAYAREVEAELRAFTEAGMRVEAGLGLNHPPAWLFERHPDAAFADQHGHRYTGAPNLVFSQAVREEAAAYADQIVREIGLGGFWALRIGVDENGEFAYPPPASRGGSDFWAYDGNAQTGRGTPPEIPADPFPGWRPGQHTYRGRPFTAGQAAQWNDWYLTALAGAVDWETALYRGRGFRGVLKVLVPGTGYRPADLRAGLDARLGGGDRLLGRGVGFFSTIPKIKYRDGVQIVSTALVDGSGRPRNNGCTAGDARVDLATSDSVRTWSSARWVAAIAARAGFAAAGESAGPQVAAYHPGVIGDAARQMSSCGLRGMMWAFDRTLYDGTPGSSLQDYADVIARFRS